LPYKISNEANRLGVIITLYGLVKGDEIFEVQKLFMSDESFPQWRYQIWDFSNAVELEISFDQLRSFAIKDSVLIHKNPNQRIAIIPRKNSQSGLDRIFHVFEEVWGGYKSKSFVSLDTAREWAIRGS